MKRVGHKGADLIVPGNTPESFDAALALGVDMIEFDVLPERGGDRLLLAHDYGAAAKGERPTLEEGLDHLASPAFEGVELDVDLKLPGYELRVLDALRERDLLARTLISSHYRDSLARIRASEAGVRLGWSVPRVRRDYTASPFTILPALGLLQVARQALPVRASRAIRSGEIDALMCHWRLVTPRLAKAVRTAGGELYVWTVDELARIRRLQALGVDGVITNDPRLFEQLSPASVEA
jgi:glycerophosphoryl diester phosphodiesterase